MRIGSRPEQVQRLDSDCFEECRKPTPFTEHILRVTDNASNSKSTTPSTRLPEGTTVSCSPRRRVPEGQFDVAND